MNYGDSIDDNDDVEIDIESDMSDDEIAYLKKEEIRERNDTGTSKNIWTIRSLCNVLKRTWE